MDLIICMQNTKTNHRKQLEAQACDDDVGAGREIEGRGKADCRSALEERSGGEENKGEKCDGGGDERVGGGIDTGECDAVGFDYVCVAEEYSVEEE